MNNRKHWTTLLALTLSAAVLGALAMRLRGRRVRVAQDEQHRSNLKEWENEGGNFAPAANPPSTAAPALQP
jgi:hypothetical protein